MSHEARSAGAHGGRAPAETRGAGSAGAIGKHTLIEQLSHGEAASPVQRRTGAGPGAAADPGAVKAAAAHGTSGPGGPLPFRDAIQRAFGPHDVSGIGAHLGGEAGEGAARMGAEAFAMGNQVAFAGAPTLHAAAHEAAHVVQQRAGVHVASGVGDEGDAYERHADAVADRVVQGASAEDLLDGAGPAGAGAGASAGTAVQRKVKVGEDVRTTDTLGGVAKTDRAAQVLREMVDADAEYAFANDEELEAFVAEAARTDWGVPPTDDQQPLDQRVSSFAGGRVGKHVWASDHRQDGDLRVTRTNTMTKRFRNNRKTSGLPPESHRVVGEVPPPETKKKLGTTEHVYSAMLTSLSPAAGDDERQIANTEVHREGSVMNCEQFVAYSLWGGGVIKDWELALIYAACAQENKMERLYRAMGLAVAQQVMPQGESLGLGAVSVLFEVRDPEQRFDTVSHMLLYTSGVVIELNAGKLNPDQWKVRSTVESDHARHIQQGKPTLACPVSEVPTQLQDTLRAIATGWLLAPKLVAGQPTDPQNNFGFLKYQQG